MDHYGDGLQFPNWDASTLVQGELLVGIVIPRTVKEMGFTQTRIKISIRLLSLLATGKK